MLVADCHNLIREGLAALLSRQPDIEVVAEAENGEQAIALFRKQRPDVAVVDLRMNETGAVAAIKTIRTDFPDARILVLATYPEDEEIIPALRAGAIDCLLKDTPREKMFEVIRAVFSGERPYYFLQHDLSTEPS